MIRLTTILLATALLAGCASSHRKQTAYFGIGFSGPAPDRASMQKQADYPDHECVFDVSIYNPSQLPRGLKFERRCAGKSTGAYQTYNPFEDYYTLTWRGTKNGPLVTRQVNLKGLLTERELESGRVIFQMHQDRLDILFFRAYKDPAKCLNHCFKAHPEVIYSN